VSEADARALIHELQVHQIELEMQNEELQRAQAAAEEASEKYHDLFDFAPVGYFLWDAEGSILEVNLAGAMLLGLTRKALIQKRFGQFIAMENRPAFADFCKRVLRTDTQQTCEVKLLHAGQPVYVLVEGIAATDHQGQRKLCCAAVIDITLKERAKELATANRNLQSEIAARKKSEEALRESEERFRLLVEGVKDCAIFMLDPNGRVVTWNMGAERLKGYAPQEIVGQHFSLFHPPEDVAVGKPQRELTIAAEQEQYIEEGWRVRKDGSRFWAEVTMTAIRGEAGELRGFAKLTRDMTERKQAEVALIQAKTAAEAANAAKSQFLANMSHELRTPMNAILGMIDVALPKVTERTVHDCLQTAKESADILLTLLNDLLDSAKIESGKLELESAPFSLRRILDQITHILAVRASEKGLRFYCRMPDETPDVVVGDRVRLQQVLLNLAGNAIKFTQRGEVEISLHVLWQDGEATLNFAVRDTGIGIPPFGQERLFQPFAQADVSMARRFGGTGLGLSICKRLVEMMGGRIWVESEVGKGSTFYFTVRLPLAKDLPPDFDVPLAVPTVPCAQLRILLAEDNPANQKIAAYVLQARGHIVEIVGDGQEAIRLSEQNRYDVILMDVQLPEMDGLEATAAIRKREDAATEDGGRRVPIIAMTAHAMKSDRDRCLAAGMDGYLSKPVNAQEMIGLVETLATQMNRP